jgi:uncharacterized protein (DUF1697 family)
MTTHIALLRGINVGGQKPLHMEDLRSLCSSVGCTNVETYLQSGNIVFTSGEKNQAKMEEILGEAIMNKFGYDVAVIIRSPTELQKIHAYSPFEIGSGGKGVYITFLRAKPPQEMVKSLTLPVGAGKDRFQIKGREIYVSCPDGYGRSKLTNTFFEKNLGMAATTRNWNTLFALMTMGNVRG